MDFSLVFAVLAMVTVVWSTPDVGPMATVARCRVRCLEKVSIFRVKISFYLTQPVLIKNQIMFLLLKCFARVEKILWPKIIFLWFCFVTTCRFATNWERYLRLVLAFLSMKKFGGCPLPGILHLINGLDSLHLERNLCATTKKFLLEVIFY